MRFVIVAASAALLLAPVGASYAQTTTAPAAPSTAAPAPAPAAPTAEQGAAPAPSATGTAKKTVHRHRQTLQQHFDAANSSKDGHLTLDQAKAARWSYVERHFSAIDKDHKGYVTSADIHAYAAANRAARHHHTSTTSPAAGSGAAPDTGAPAAAPSTSQTPE